MPSSAADSPVLVRANRVITPEGELSPGWVTVAGGAIAAVGEDAGPPAERVEELGDVSLAPGFVDVHVHGGGGHSLTTADPAQIEAYAAWAPRTGVTSFLATVVATDVAEGVRFCQAIASARPRRGANLLGVNLEGPFLSPKRPGAIPQSWIAPPDLNAFERLREACDGRLRLMTVAPEVAGAAPLIQDALSNDVTVSVGHTDATFDGALAAFGAGARHVTHAFNAMRPFHHRDPGPVGAALASDAVTIEIIADGVHLHEVTVRMLVQAFGARRVALITDATPLAGAGDGSFQIGGTVARVRDGRATLADGTIAGSVATMDEMVRSVVRWGVCGVADAALMASTVPASVAGAGERKGKLAAGYDADMVALDSDLRVVRSWVGGETAFDVKKQ